MSDMLSRDQFPDQTWIGFAQADMSTSDGCDSPCEAPAIAMEHGKGPKVHAFGAEPDFNHFAKGIKECAAVGVNHPFGPPGRP